METIRQLQNMREEEKERLKNESNQVESNRNDDQILEGVRTKSNKRKKHGEK